MKLFTSKMLERLMSGQKKKSEGLLPEIVKRLIQSKCSDLSYLRVPDGDDIWAPGYDGIVVNENDLCSSRKKCVGIRNKFGFAGKN